MKPLIPHDQTHIIAQNAWRPHVEGEFHDYTEGARAARDALVRAGVRLALEAISNVQEGHRAAKERYFDAVEALLRDV